MKGKREVASIEIADLEKELGRTKYKSRYRRVLRSTIFTLVTVAAVAVLIATIWLPVLQIYGSSMNPTLYEGQIVVSVKGKSFEHGDVVALYYGNKLLVKRCIATGGEWVNIDENGVVYVNDEPVEEPYITEHAFGECNIELPYQVPEEKIFVMGDNRATSIDSRNTSVGPIAYEEIVGKIVFRVWPLKVFGTIG